MRNSFVSIIVLTYKDFSKIEKTLLSCFEQDYEHTEIIVRDDGSPNFKREIIEKFFSKYNYKGKYKVIHGEINCGTVINFNEAIKQSSGEFIVVVSGDDYLIDKSAVSKIVKKFNEDDKTLCVTARERHMWPDGREVILPSPYEEYAIKHFSCSKLWYLISANPCFIVGSATSYRRVLFEKIGLFDENYKLLEDWPFYLKMFENNIRISFLPYETIFHSSGGVSTAKGISRNKMLVKDDLLCISHAIDSSEIMKLSYLQKRFLYYRRELLSNELEEKDNIATNRKNRVLSLIVFVRNKIKNLSLRLDIRKICL